MYLQSNTGNKIARLLADWPGLPVERIVREIWPKTKQPEKKARTVEKYIRGINRECGRREMASRVRDLELGRAVPLRTKFSGFPRLARESRAS